ncbi:MAG: class IV adenylate cyclase [Gemmatimonadaceae bacterium]
MREVELKAIVDDLAERRKIIEAAGATLSFEGKISDRRYDFPSRELTSRDEVLRTRRYLSQAPTRIYLDWKGATETRDVYKTREELTTSVEDQLALETILEKIGLELTWEIDRDIAQYQFRGATIRFETYPRMDVLVEVEGDPAAIEEAISALGMPRGIFTNERLADFVTSFERRTGVRAAVSERELRD